MWENADQNNPKYGHFSHSVHVKESPHFGFFYAVDVLRASSNIHDRTVLRNYLTKFGNILKYSSLELPTSVTMMIHEMAQTTTNQQKMSKKMSTK